VTRFLLICLGGAIGTGARYLTALWAASALGLRFPYGTLIVNLAGSFLLGLVMEISAPGDLRLAMTSGVLGGFTTYSSFNYETTNSFRNGAWLLGSVNVAVTLLGCAAAGVAGILVGRLLKAP